mmetsp:Transcript_85812/g.223158  ORF Transcript_85812/g.223158 Transcript_85812/m.223158 type:complete len:206 (-) Transcript_85812:1615-2232(-)
MSAPTNACEPLSPHRPLTPPPPLPLRRRSRGTGEAAARGRYMVFGLEAAVRRAFSKRFIPAARRFSMSASRFSTRIIERWLTVVPSFCSPFKNSCLEILLPPSWSGALWQRISRNSCMSSAPRPDFSHSSAHSASSLMRRRKSSSLTSPDPSWSNFSKMSCTSSSWIPLIFSASASSSVFSVTRAMWSLTTAVRIEKIAQFVTTT